MKKRLFSAWLALCLCFTLFGCSNEANTDSDKYKKKPLFASETEFRKHIEDHCWITTITDDNSVTRVRMFVFDSGKCAEYVIAYNSDNYSLEEAFYSMINSQPGNYEDVYSFLAAANTTGINKYFYTVSYNSEENKITSDEKTWFVYENYISCANIQYSLVHEQSQLSTLETAFNNAYSQLGKDTFLSRYPNIASYKDVKYDPYSYLGDNFVIEGKAELDDYYNYDYRNFESVYFCMRVTPYGGSYSDIWYIYADRDDFSKLYETLKKGSIQDITLVCLAHFPSATKESMATLMNYNIN